MDRGELSLDKAAAVVLHTFTFVHPDPHQKGSTPLARNVGVNNINHSRKKTKTKVCAQQTDTVFSHAWIIQELKK